MQEAFDKELNRLIPASDVPARVLLAVSGGIDSMCMANLFLNSCFNLKFAVAHVNFSLRGTESDGDEALVKEWCEQHEVEFFSNKFDTHKFAEDNSISTQMAARDLRYAWFYMLMDKYAIEYLAIAHNLNDSVETLFLNLLRGTGLNGMSGIKDVNGKIIRPLLQFTRAQITQFVEEHDIKYREDATNRESHYMRNRIRNDVFPHFAKINPSFLATIQTEMNRFAEVGEIMEEQYKLREGVLYKVENEILYISIDSLKKEKFRGYWLYRILNSYGFNDTQIAQIDLSLDGQSGKSFTSSTHILIRDREYLKVYSNKQEIKSIKVIFKKFPKPDGFDPASAPAGTLHIDAKGIRLPLNYRGWQSADRFRPFGMKGYKKLSDFFIDLKLDLEEKKQQIVVTTVDRNGKEQIVCVVGKRIDDRYKITAATKYVISISKE
ncbi:MAG: tRNA lysidine(34) synthetase TilS [Bacteroidales bacterium]|nr:tRNA lysidine(34) synthetase TilS [Bacteroidales bacterium]MDD4670490.1 tRNA lysidine(34) synthetase TilS [Bacteroidales bacterium]